MSHAECRWNGKRPLDTADHDCRRCDNGQGHFPQWDSRPIWIMALTVTALGPSSLLLVWRTPRLGRTARRIATVAIAGVTVYLGQQVWQTLRMPHSLLVSIS